MVKPPSMSDMSSGDETAKKAANEAEALMAKLQREQCYLVFLKPVENPPDPGKSQGEMRLEHHDWLVEMERQGILFAAGPTRDPEEWIKGSGLLILRAPNREEATKYAEQEPYTKYGQRIQEIIPWQRNEGTVSINIRMADGELQIDNRRWSLGPPKE